MDDDAKLLRKKRGGSPPIDQFDSGEHTSQLVDTIQIRSAEFENGKTGAGENEGAAESQERTGMEIDEKTDTLKIDERLTHKGRRARDRGDRKGRASYSELRLKAKLMEKSALQSRGQNIRTAIQKLEKRTVQMYSDLHKTYAMVGKLEDEIFSAEMDVNLEKLGKLDVSELVEQSEASVP